ncbi:MAG: peroxiredoxin [Psychromonas sp.]|jgi:peroxiredoxin
MKLSLSLFALFFSLLCFSQTPKVAEDISPLLIGEKIPNATLIDLDGVEVNVLDLAKKKRTVLVFYRGDWCPYCTRHLAAFNEIQDEILALDYQIIAVTPDDVLNLQPLKEEKDLSFTLFSDPKGQFIKDLGIAFLPNERTNKYMEAKTKGEVTKVLPVPTVMVIDQGGTILFEYINPNYSQRMSGELLLSILSAL